ncbi:MAG TPA: hypothetical protein VGS98_17200 [Thermoanaerobaculia bacterium]|nr:hypothetical protein [Thermoanaerobaculia bacterium]
MSVFTGGSAYTMVRDIADGFVLPTELTFKQFRPNDFAAFSQEADKFLREIRGNPPLASDVEGTQKRHRRMQRLQQAMTVARSIQSRR